MDNKVRFYPRVGTATGKRRGWMKHITGCDPDGHNGYALRGEFLSSGHEVELPAGALILRVDPRGTIRQGWERARLYRLQQDGKMTSLLGGGVNWRKDFTKLRNAVIDSLGAAATDNCVLLTEISDAELVGEVRRRGLKLP